MFSILELSGLPSREASSSPPPPSEPSLHCLSITDHLLKLSPLSVFVNELPCVLAWSSKPNMTPTRAASHAGSWYSGNARELGRQLDEWLACAGTRVGQARAIISPHAGYSYCGDTAAYAYKQIVPEKVERVFILGPSHVVSLSGCALTTCRRYRTPLGDLNIDQQVNDELRETRQFETMDRRDEEAEHSIEMQLPFVAKVMENQPAGSYSIIPVLVGSLATSRQASYGAIFARYISDPHNLFIVSSDFCHWGECLGSWNQGPGSRFHFTPHDSSNGRPIHEQISALDKEGMEAIASLQPQIFNDYLRKTQNTICGRNPICVLLQAAEHFRVANNHTHELRFMKYSQSNQCRSTSDSSVSYAAAALFVHPR